MARNSLGREVPETWNGRRYDPYQDPFSRMPTMDRATRPLVRRNPGESKVLPSLRAAIEKSGLRDGMTIATHHHLRNGDVLLNLHRPGTRRDGVPRHLASRRARCTRCTPR